MQADKQQIWHELKEKLPYENTEADKQLRDKYWNGMDVNGNGYLSLAEIDKGMRDAIRIPILFDLKPVLMRAYQSAKNKLKSKNQYGDDYVSRAQFRYLLSYLRQYYEYWIGFDRIDSDDDRRIDLQEFTKAVPMIKKWGIKINSPEQAFKEADSDGHGKILFVEFCSWAIKKNLDLDDDDDAL